MQFIANDQCHIRDIHRVLCETSESIWHFILAWRCDHCVQIGKNNINDKRRVSLYKTSENYVPHLTSRNYESEEEIPGEGSLEEQLIMEAEAESELEVIVNLESEREGEKIVNLEAEAEAEKIPIPENCYCDEIGFTEFLDSYKIMSSSLSNLVENLKTKQRKCLVCEASTTTCSDCQIELTKLFPATAKYVKNLGNMSFLRNYLKKNAFPHELIQSCDHLKSITEFPTKESFFSSLTMMDVCQEIYEDGKFMWTLHNCTNLFDYSQLYLQVNKRSITVHF